MQRSRKTSPSKSTASSSTRWPWLVVAVVTAIVFLPVVSCEFLKWDDQQTITGNPQFLPVSGSSIAWFWNPQNAPGSLWIPLTYTLWGILSAITREAWAFHLLNLILHVGSALLATRLIRRLTNAPLWIAALAGLIFSLHPVQVESVAWASGLKDVLSGMLCLAALNGYVSGAEEAKHRWRWWGAATGIFLLAMLSKPAAVMLPGMALIIDVFFLSGPLSLRERVKVRADERDNARSSNGIESSVDPHPGSLPEGEGARARYILIGLWLLLALPIVVLAKHHQPAPNVFVPPMWQRLFVAGDALAWDFKQLIIPIQLAPDYSRTPDWLVAQGATMFVTTAIAILIVASIAWLARNDRRWLGAVLIIVASVSPVLGLVPFEYQTFSTVSDHYLYLATLGPAIAVAMALMRWKDRRVTIAVSILIGLFAIRSFTQTFNWQTTDDLWRHSLAVVPDGLQGNRWAGREAGRVGNHQLAIEHYQIALKIRPTLADLRYDLGNAYFRSGQPERAIEQYKLAVQYWPANSRDKIDVHNNWGIACLMLGRSDEALAQFEQSLRIDPANEMARKGVERAKAGKLQ